VVALITIACATGGPTVGADDVAGVAGRVSVSPLRVALDLSRSTAAAGSKLLARATVWNDAGVVIRGIRVDLRVDPVGLVIRRPIVRLVKAIDPLSARSVTWSLCGTQPGGYVVLAQVTFGGTTIESRARTVTVGGDRRTRC
jgi:hypothetical protein